jgi:HlyD family secretion protein
MKKKLAVAALILALGAAAATFYRYGNQRDEGVLFLSGNVDATEVNVGFKFPGRVRALFTDEGRTVAAGDRIAALDSAEFEAQVNQNKAAVRNAEALLEKARRDYERSTALFQGGMISPEQMDSARTAYDVAASQLEMSLASLRTAEVRYRDTVIYSPLAGVVLGKNVEEGETVAAGSPVFTIGDLERPWVRVYVKSDQLGLVKLGQKAGVMVDSFPKKRYEGVVTQIASEAEFTPKNVQTREERVKLVFGVKVSVKNENSELKPGMPADVEIRIK